ncbi:sulfonate ABC transporter ATP-binding protein [Streptomyces antibioticus]|uniref:sulfonate ABC transporter ATP-binding protein n=1 Tax=Streptomyces antibioticus TaxID=1890 RepID=UPI003715E5F0
MANDGQVRVPWAVRVEGLRHVHGGRAVVDGLRLDVRPGEFVALIGGGGRSALLRVLAGVDRDVEGTVLVPRRRALVSGAARPTAWERVRRAVLPGRAGARPAASIRALAPALADEPDLLLLDDPFGALDAPARAKARRLLDEWWQRRECAVLLVTDDVEEAVLLADRVLVMDAGAVAHERRIGLGRPRDPADPRFAVLRAGLVDRLPHPAGGRSVRTAALGET